MSYLCIIFGVYYRAAEEGRGIADEKSTSFNALAKIISNLRSTCGDAREPSPQSNEQTRDFNQSIDPLLGAKIHLGF